MTKARRKRKRKVNKRPNSLRVASQSTKTAENTPLSPGVAKLDPGKTVITTKEIFIEAPAESCFDTLSRQLEQPPQWDPMIVRVSPTSDVRGWIGATSRVILYLGSKKVESQAIISRYHPSHSISWVISRKPKVREDWQLERKPHGTQVRVTLAHELDGWVIGRLIYKVMSWKKVEQDLDRMLAQLKETIESTKS